ncbi:MULTISPECIES: hypothetical protein [unclassified Rhizobium]|uniref:hypothetical protein n=1 Tax=unclassified Rhizobium TaxID=2613769 RepID=UPI001ADB825F|nr:MULTISPECIES: hypothetical protein [unclassified Rhizobium]MBO9097975.1 hypothetical protein [Rhizobium sp. L58/93]MBO9133242.1 hypothetical protein [Rhizobium sp. B209b/85]MBO9168126.1 hypothetical protein [Rhizobium sp. L245/93]MBO9184171.1 hypothetical protein [Rhizobium sp. E27B/91]QXZ84378.1 hypothetical protein J5287_02150 [Rhizobium sp. K1/93]
MRTTEIFAVTMALLALGGCQRQDSDGPTELNGRHFVFNYRVSTATYLVNLALKAPIPDGSFAIAEFENPMGGDPLVVREKIFPLWDKITLQSPAVHCVRKDRPYAVNIRLVDGDGKTFQTIKTQVISDVDQSVLTARPLVVGPGYTVNPDLVRPDGSIDFSPEKCPTG